MKLAIAVPTYNEATNIKKLVPSLYKNLKNYPELSTTLFVVDDNSPDGTSKVATELSRKYKAKNFELVVLNRKKKEGLGKAYVYAFKHILKQKKYDYILQMDADLSHDPKYIPAMLDLTKEADFVVGSRYIPGGDTPDWTWNRKLLSNGGNLYTRIFLGNKIHDYTGGFNLYSADLLHSVDLGSLQAGGYGFLIELKYRALLHCKNSAEVPIIFMDRQHGISKIPRSTIFRNLLLVPQLVYRNKLHSN